MRKSIVRAAIAAAGLVGAAGFSSAASATDFSINTNVPGGNAWVIDPPGYLVGTLHDGGYSVTAYIGVIDLKGALVNDPGAGLTDLKVFCIDVNDDLRGGTFTESSIADLENPGATNMNVHYTAQQVSDLTKFLAYVDTQGVTNSLTSAVAQLGVWEIISEANDTNWNLTNGNFYITGMDNSVLTMANSWLANSRGQSTVGYTLHVLDPDAGNQTQAFVTHVPGQTTTDVPEPATWGMIVLGFGLLGSALRRRKEEALFIN